MRKLLAFLPAVLILSACTSSPERVATPIPTASVNEVACIDFAKATVPLLDAFTGKENVNDVWDAEMSKIDIIGLAAEGQVQERILGFVADAPKTGDIFAYPEAREQVNEMVDAVVRACSAEGYEILVNQFVAN